MDKYGILFTTLVVVLHTFYNSVVCQTGRIKCYTDNNQPQRCIPEFVNAAWRKKVIANNTCGTPPSRYCVQTGVTGATKICQICDASSQIENHPADYTTDIKDDTDKSWWQSETLFENKHPVWLILDLGKTYDITYIRIRFHTSRPQSFRISKKVSTEQNSPWIPYQYYSGSCRRQYGLEDKAIVTRSNQKVALCTNEFSNISPLSGGNVAFSTLEHRPEAYNFDNSPELQDWVTASAIRIDLDKLNTFGDEVFGDEYVLRSYYFAISDWAIGGRCKCNGHASECVTRILDGGKKSKIVCRCEHSTAGDDCQKCAPLYNDIPWRRATARNSNPCSRCECNDLADSCVFDPILYQTRGRGGRCVDCKNNTAGINCEKCKVNHFRKEDKEACKPCNCNSVGSRSLQCNNEGVCECRPGVTGEKCDQCAPGYYSFSNRGCKPCLCSKDGSTGENCDATGQCRCKPYVTGKQCDECKVGFFDLDGISTTGCKPCFCHGHGDSCTEKPGVGRKELLAEFAAGLEGWRIMNADGKEHTTSDGWNSRNQYLQIDAPEYDRLYLVAPQYFLGNRLSSYGKIFSFVYGVTNIEGIKASDADIIFEGAGLTASFPITAQGNPLPAARFLQFEYTIKEPQGMKPFDFQTLLSQLTAIKIRVKYTKQMTGVIDKISFESTRIVSENSPDQVTWQEQCLCEIGYNGQFCESCDSGYTREANRTDSFGRCVPCECNGHSDECDPTTGICNCQHKTGGKSCDVCLSGYYGNPTRGTPEDCQKCPCVVGNECIAIGTRVQCTNCPPGHEGDLCEKCQDGYFGDPEGRLGPATGCRPCNCNDNIDANAIGNCNTTTGECLKCIYNTKNGLFNACENCEDGYYGDALALPKGQCKACSCFQNGTVWPKEYDPSKGRLPCDAKGQCQCRQNVTGLDCGSCQPGLWGVASGNGCMSCFCDAIGSNNTICDVETGKCECKSGIGGRTCDSCSPGHFEFSKEGCQSCDCNPDGSQYVNCTTKGECICRPGVLGVKCDSCPENKFNLSIGCISCPRCFNLVRDAVNSLRSKLKEIDSIIRLANITDVNVKDEEFEKALKDLLSETDILENKVRNLTDKDVALREFFDELKDKFSMLMKSSDSLFESVKNSANTTSISGDDSMEVKRVIEEIKSLLNKTGKELVEDGKKFLDNLKINNQGASNNGKQMKEIAEEARRLASVQETDSKMIYSKTKMTHNESSLALNETKMAEMYEKELEKNISKLQDNVDASSSLADELKMKMIKLMNTTKQTMMLSDEIYTEAIKPLPDFRINQTKASADMILVDALPAIQTTKDVILDTKQLIQNLTESEIEARDLMSRGNKLRDDSNEFYRRAKEAYEKAKTAQEKANRTAYEATRTLDILKGFNEQVEKSKRNATEALKLVPLIRRLIAEAGNHSIAAESNRSVAEDSADESHGILNKSNNTLMEVKKNLTDAHQKLTGQINKTADFEFSINETLRDLNNASMKLDDYKMQAIKDAKSIKDAQTSADNATAKALNVQNELNKALDTLDEIVAVFANLEKLDLEKLQDAEERFEIANNTIVIEFQSEIDQLKKSAESHENSLSIFDFSLEPLRRQIAHVEEIYKAFPRSCYKRAPIPETTG